MKIVVAPDSFKGSLSAEEICKIVKKVAYETFSGCEVLEIPVADGGEGTIESILSVLNGNKIDVSVKNALGSDIIGSYGIFRGNSAIIEMSKASGLPIIPISDRDIMNSNTYGTGQLILDALNKGCNKIYLGIGGSATNDCGIGCMEALGVKFLDENGKEVNPVPANFEKIVRLDTSKINSKVESAEFIIMCDVTNPLLGDKGATNVFAPQKGATEEQLSILERGMEHIISIIENQFGVSIRNLEGTGAAGGLGAILLALTNANMQSGVETILGILEFNDKIKGADLVITGEGMMDYQSAYGKVAYGVGNICKSQNIPCVAIVGGLGKDSEHMFNYGINSMMTTVNGIMELDEAITNAQNLCEQSVVRLFNFIKVGIEIGVSLHN